LLLKNVTNAISVQHNHSKEKSSWLQDYSS